MPPCSVLGCGRNTFKTFTFPKINHQTETFQNLSQQRRNAWATALGLSTSDPQSWEKAQICDSHFISGKMAALQDVNNMDWAPTMNLSKAKDSKSDILRCSVKDCVVSNQGGQCSFYRISKQRASGKLKQISDIKLSAWITGLGLRNTVPATCKNLYVCHAHYIIDMRAKLRDTPFNGSTVLAEKLVSDSRRTLIAPVAPLNNENRRNQLRLVSPNKLLSKSTKAKSPFSKSGNILRNENGQFSFSCGYCSTVNHDCHDMMNHINTHFDKSIQSGLRLPSPEFVSCTIAPDDVNKSEKSKTFQESSNASSEPKSPDKGIIFTTSGTKSQLVPSLKRPPLPTVNIEDLVASRPCNIKRLKAIDVRVDVIDETPTIKSFTVPPKFKPIRLAPIPAELVEKLKPKASNSSDKNLNVIFQVASSEGSNNTKATCNPEILKCNQCKLEPVDGESDLRQHHCRECEEVFSSHNSYKTHFLDTHWHKALKCYQCEMEPPITIASDPRRHKCVICKDWFPNHVEFRTHLKDAHDEHVMDNDFNYFANDYREFNCYICEKTLKQRDYLAYHVKGHFEKFLEYQCHLCGLRVRSEGVLKTHIMKTHDSTPSHCDVCNKIFRNDWKMRHHRECHTTELNHVCSVCSKGFKFRKYLLRHMAVHNGTQIVCRYCDATFKFSTGRRAHEKSVHNIL